MINLFVRQLRSMVAALSCLIAIVLLQGCGGERTTPYNPTVSSSSSSAAKVTTELVTQGTQTSTVISHAEKRLQVIREEDDFYDISGAYVNINLPQPKFTNGQVVMVDLGTQDSCKQHLDFNSIRAEKAGTNSVRVVVSYQEKAAITTACTSVSTRPYYFYYVESRGPLIFEEVLL